MPAHIFDEQRRSWIAAYAGIFMFQKRRAELLGKRLRARQRGRIGMRPDSHDDQVAPPILFRNPGTMTALAENVVVLVAALIAPIGWPLGRLLYGYITTLIPETLRAYPIPALMWGGVICGAPVPLLYDPATSLFSTVVVPWLVAQVPAIFLAAGIYGILEGWLAVDGSTEWWPLTPTDPDIDDTLLLGSAEFPMATVLDPEPGKAEPIAVRRRRTPPRVRWFPMASAAVLAIAGMGWTGAQVIGSVLHHPVAIVFSTTPRPHSNWR